MHTLSLRAQRLFYWGVLNLAVAALLCHLSWYLPSSQRQADALLTVHPPRRFFAFTGGRSDLRWDQFEASFDLELRNLRHMDSWAVKQLFVIVEAAWSEGGKRNQATVWDRIIPRAQIADLHLVREKFKYPLTDRHQSLRGKTVTFRVWVETVPVAGWINRRLCGDLQLRLGPSFTA